MNTRENTLDILEYTYNEAVRRIVALRVELEETKVWSWLWKRIAKKFYALFLAVEKEWEAERNKYQTMLKNRDLFQHLWFTARDDRDKALRQRDEAREGFSKSLERLMELEEDYYQACKQRDEAVERVRYYKKKYDASQKYISRLEKLDG